MNVIFKKTKQDFRCLEKTFENARNATLQVWDSSSIMTPVFLVTYDQSLIDLNYVEVPDWGRSYYITDKKAAPGKRLYLYCDEDVLESNKSGIKNIEAYAVRQQRLFTADAVDSKMMTLVTRGCTTIPFEFPISIQGNESYLLTVAGGKIVPVQ